MDITQQVINSIRIVAAEAITKAKSGHPGICMGSAPIAYALYSDIMNYDGKASDWDNRDRFILSAGHGSALLYSTLHHFGFDVMTEDLAAFRQFGSNTPGHPEYGVTDGVEASTGPLGQGVAMAVGMALAETHLAAVFNRDGYNIVDHYTYVLCGEGCLEEGISYEACSFAGAHKLGKLILFYDCNKISIEGDTENTFHEDISMRFESQGWQAIDVPDVNDITALEKAIEKAKRDTERPSIIICHSRIGYGTPVMGTATAHGTPLSEEQLTETKKFFDYVGKPFEVSDAVKKHCSARANERAKSVKKWRKLFEGYSKAYPELAQKYKQYFAGYVPDLSELYGILKTEKPEATRISGGVVINELAKRIPNLLSGSADLTPSTKTNLVNESRYSPENRSGRNIHFGIREHAMAAICNGIALHGGLRIICSTFFVFSDYMKGAMRLSALMKLPVMYVLTHDSIGVGEDGPTHQPIEQLAMLRAMPDINVYRPSDRMETVASFDSALRRNLPSVFVMSRQELAQKNADCGNGGYIISDCGKKADLVLISSGSEVDICINVQTALESMGVYASVVSMYCTELFDACSDEYKNSVLPRAAKKVCVEASSDNIWYKYADGGVVIKINSFGASGTTDALYDNFGMTQSKILDNIRGLIS